MVETTNPHLWLLDINAELMDSSGVWLEEDYKNSDFDCDELWDPNETRHPPSGMLRYKLKGGGLTKLASYDFYPNGRSTPALSTRMKDVITAACLPGEVGFRACEILDRKGEILPAWNMYPLHLDWCIDREKSKITWFVPDLKPELVSVKWASKIVFTPDCLGSGNLMRVLESKSWIIVSDHLKNVMQALNPKGMEFTHDSYNRIGNPFGSKEAKYYSD